MQTKVNRLLLTGAALASLGGLAKAEVSFKKQVQPVLASACLSCHGEKNDKGELRLHTHEGLLEGSEYGKVVVPGKPEKSSLYTSTVLLPDDDDIMPAKGELLTSDQANVLKEWIAAGAKWPEGLVIQQVRRIDFAKDIKPILESSCVSCHREGHDKGDLRLDEREHAFEAGEYGTAIVPFDLEKSTLYQSVTLPANHDDLMPPSNKGGPLPQEQLDLLRDWIVQGAAWPEGLKLEQTRRDTGKQPVAGGSLAAAPKVVIDIRTKAIEKLIRQLEPTMKPYEDEIPGTGVKFEMVPIPSGEFVMGSPADEPGRKATEGPTHTVKIAPFWMGKTETTWNTYTLFIYEEEERMVMKIRGYKPELNAVSDAVARPTTPYVEMSFGMGTDDFPAISMTQHAANTYCKWLTAKTGHYYRLPTEAEWEYACRAGTTTMYSFGDDPALASTPGTRATATSSTKKSARKNPTRGACTTCTATCPSGRSTSSSRIFTRHSRRPFPIPSSTASRSTPASPAVAHGWTSRRGCAAPAVSRPRPTGSSRIRSCPRASGTTPTPNSSGFA